MGIHSARRIAGLAAAAGIGHPATRLAYFIATETLDFAGDNGEPINTFWAGRDSLAIALGYAVHEYDQSDEGQRATRAAHEAVKRAIRELIGAGILERIASGTGRQHSQYRLIVGAPPSRRQPRRPVENSERGGW